jgi:Fe2+ or Zn2+ uptake regulation protein
MTRYTRGVQRMKTCTHTHLRSGDIERLFKRHSITQTQNRKDILAFLDGVHVPLSIQDIQKRMRSAMDVVTVYRNIELFAKKGVVRRIDYKKDEKLYELVRDDDHHHIVCTRCKKVGDFDGCLSEAMIRSALKQNKDFARVDTHSFELFGLCKKCYTKHI